MAAKFLIVPSIKKSLVLSAFAATLLVSAVLGAQQPDPNPIPPPAQPTPTSPAAPTAPVPQSGAPAGASPSSHLMRTWRRLTYTCDAGAKVVVNVHAKQARLVFKGKAYNLHQTDEANGQFYEDGSIAWHIKDDVGKLELLKSGTNISLATGCQLQSTGTNPSAPPAKTPSSQ